MTRSASNKVLSRLQTLKLSAKMWMSHTIEKRRGMKSEGLLKNGVDVGQGSMYVKKFPM